MNPERRLAELEGRVAAIGRAVQSGPSQTTFGGATSSRVVQPGFPAKLTSSYSATTGYDWEAREVLTAAPIADATNPLAGDHAWEVAGDTTLTAGTKVWMEPDPQARGWVFSKGGSGGSVTADEFQPALSDFTMTLPGGVYETITGFTIDLPSAGTYFVYAAVSGIFRVTTFAASSATATPLATVYDSTGTQYVAQCFFAGLQVTGRNLISQAQLFGLYSPNSGPRTLVVKVSVDSLNTYGSAVIYRAVSAGSKEARIGYIKIA